MSVATAYIADDGTQMIEVSAHHAINRCAYNGKRHVWKPHDDKEHWICLGCGCVVTEIPRYEQR